MNEGLHPKIETSAEVPMEKKLAQGDIKELCKWGSAMKPTWVPYPPHTR
jgi:hypothetical protein